MLKVRVDLIPESVTVAEPDEVGFVRAARVSPRNVYEISFAVSVDIRRHDPPITRIVADIANMQIRDLVPQRPWLPFEACRAERNSKLIACRDRREKQPTRDGR